MKYLNNKFEVNIHENNSHTEIGDYLNLAIRKNKKRRFLFVNRYLGKHLAVNPKLVLEQGKELGKRAMECLNKNEKVAVIGFAETATALGNIVFSALESKNKVYYHTTREILNWNEVIEFKEEHSHAREQLLYLNESFDLNNYEKIMLVDDELTTGKTCINIIRELNKNYKNKEYIIVSILNWMGKEDYEKYITLEKELSVNIKFVNLVNGSFKNSLEDDSFDMILEDHKEYDDNIVVKEFFVGLDKVLINDKYSNYTGRFGLNYEMDMDLEEKIKKISKKIQDEIVGESILILGTEEFMYIPLKVGAYIEKDVYFHSTTRSPIEVVKEEGYCIKSKKTHSSFYNKGVVNYVYNLGSYDNVVIFLENKNSQDNINKVKEMFMGTNNQRISIVYLN